MRKISTLLIVLFILFTKNLGSYERQEMLRGFSEESRQRQQELEGKLKQILLPRNAEEHLRWLTSRPHLTGTEGTRITAEYIKDKLISYGLPAETETYTAYLTAPVSVSIEIVAPVQERIPTTEEPIEGDPFTEHVDQHPGWNGYSPSGDVTAQVVYASHGSSGDIEQLQSMGVDLKGKILLMRYFGTGEGTKVRNAEDAGAAGVILYTDPEEDGYRYGDVYPEGNWRPAGSIMRRSIIPLWYDGDPLSPGWASVPGAKRLRPEEIALPKIPVLPISYRSAERILSMMDGPVAPFSMQGGLPLPYKVGPGPVKIHMRTEMDNGDRPILNILSRIEGERYKDQWIIVGNHHDAWIFGAGDPSSGTASLLEFARGLGEMIKQGYRPQRTLILAFWDAEEMLLGGSTEWVEHYRDELLQKAVACINMDSSVFNTGRPLSVNAHPVLHELFREVTRDIKDPKTGKSMFEAWTDLQNEYRQTPSVDGWGYFFDPDKELKEPWIFESPSDDAAPFFHQLALPASDMYYGADYGMYHSIYENFHWMKTVVDPTFEYHIAMAQLQGFVALRLANADLIPLDYRYESTYWRKAYNSLQESAAQHGKKVPMLEEAMKAIDMWEKEAAAFEREKRDWLNKKQKTVSDERLAEINRKIYLAARDFYRPEGAPGRSLERNMWPNVLDLQSAIERGNASSEASVYLKALQKRINTMQALRKALSAP